MYKHKLLAMGLKIHFLRQEKRRKMKFEAKRNILRKCMRLELSWRKTEHLRKHKTRYEKIENFKRKFPGLSTMILKIL